MAAPVGVLPVGPAAATIEAEEDADGSPLGATTEGSDSGHH
jgi:hypothetical protein